MITPIEYLLDEWKEHQLAYERGEETITDAEFDQMEDILLSFGDSDTINIVKNAIARRGSLVNTNPYTETDPRRLMVSIRKCKLDDTEGIKTHLDRLWNLAVEKKFYLTPKYDGCALKFEHFNGETRAYTRGGQDVTEKVAPVTPKTMKEGEIVVGELILSKSEYKKIASLEYKTARAFVAGFLNGNKNISGLVKYELDFKPTTDGMNTQCPEAIEASREDVMEKLMAYMNEVRSESYPYECDGIVVSVKVDKRIIEDKYPTNFIAIKPQSEAKPTTVTNIIWQVGKSGRCTPVVEFEPIELLGTTVTRASAFSYGWLMANNISIGSIVIVTKSGDIIPYITQVLCAGNGNIGRRNEEDCYQRGEHLYLVTAIREQITQAVEKMFKILDIKNVGLSTCGKIVDTLKITESDGVALFTVFSPNNKLPLLERLGDAEYKNVSAIWNIKNIQLTDVIRMANFEGVGEVTAEQIAKFITKYPTNEELPWFQNVPEYKGVSEAIKERFMWGGETPEREALDEIQDMLAMYGINIIAPSDKNTDNLPTFEMTGNPPSGTKEDYIKRLDGKAVHTALTKKTDYLVTDSLNSNSSKMQKARKYGTKIVLYGQFWASLGNDKGANNIPIKLPL